MFTHTDLRNQKAPYTLARAGVRKFLIDIQTILEIKFRFLLRGWFWYLIRPIVFPLSMFYFLSTVADTDNPETVLRVITGALVFGVALMMSNMLAQMLLQDRFLGRLKLLITMPISKAAYATSIVIFAATQAIPVVILLLAFAYISGVPITLTWAFLPLITVVLVSLAGPTFIIASYAPSPELGSIIANLFGIALVIMSPVFFTMEQAPLLLEWLGWISPMRYAADGIMKSLSGSNDVWLELTILGGFAIGSTALGLWKLRWREP